MKDKIEWIDNIKGFGIICVVIGHITHFENSFIFLFHIPLFFFISGYLFNFKPTKTYFIGKTKHLLLPYFVYLTLILIPQMLIDKQPIIKIISRFLLGGRFLYTWTGVFWFTTCLFFTQQIINLLQKVNIKVISILMLIFLCSAYINSIYWNKNIPLNINVCLFSCPIFFLGYLMKDFIRNSNIHLAVIILSIGSIIVLSHIFPHIKLDMKNSDYGIPIVSFCLSIIIVLSFIFLFKKLHLGSSLGIFGKASMVIMYLHQPIHYIFTDFLHVTNQWFITIIAILIPLAFYYLFNKSTITKKYLLGA